jgi:acyl-coenzyme A synthetase/AMP-(fatty) acid ligase
MSLFWVDDQRGYSLSYQELIEELNKRDIRHPVVKTDDPAELFIELLLAIFDDGELVLLDADFSDDTLSQLGFGEDGLPGEEPMSEIDIEHPREISSKIGQVDDDWPLGLYTSGTTGTPERVEQTLDGLTRNVKRDEKFKNDVWAFAYNPSHFAGLQVFFQAIANLNPIIYIFEQSIDQIHEAIDKYEITHISATPTFYRLRLQRLNGEFPTVRRLTSGGERFEPSLRESLQNLFPNAKFRNVYALTEAGSLLESNGELFQIPQRFSDQIRVTEENELAIHKSLLADSVADEVSDGWFYTGDLVEYETESQFRFVGRESDFVNIGGYRVNPHEVEEMINNVDSVKAATVTARESSVTGHILVAEVEPIARVDSEVIKERVKSTIEELEKWKQPRIIDIVDEINQSRSGKRVR